MIIFVGSRCGKIIFKLFCMLSVIFLIFGVYDSLILIIVVIKVLIMKIFSKVAVFVKVVKWCCIVVIKEIFLWYVNFNCF